MIEPFAPGARLLISAEESSRHRRIRDPDRKIPPLQFDRMERYRKLRDFYEKRGLKKEAEWVAARLAAAGRENP